MDKKIGRVLEAVATRNRARPPRHRRAYLPGVENAKYTPRAAASRRTHTRGSVDRRRANDCAFNINKMNGVKYY